MTRMDQLKRTWRNQDRRRAITDLAFYKSQLPRVVASGPENAALLLGIIATTQRGVRT